jgi:hypothetical protein
MTSSCRRALPGVLSMRMEVAMKRFMLLVLALCPVLAAQPQCTAGRVSGTYVVSYDGWALMPQQGSPLPLTVPGVILGVVSIGYDGTLRGGETVIIAGQAVEYDITGGSVSMNSDCTGTMRILVKVKGSSDKPAPVTERFAVVMAGQEIEIRTTVLNSPDATVGAMAIGVWKRMSPTPGSASW